MTTTNEPGVSRPPSIGRNEPAAGHADDIAPNPREDPRALRWPDEVNPEQDDTWYRYREDPRRARRAERKIAICFTITALASLGIMILYCLGGTGQPQAEGALLFFAFAGLGVGFVLWARDLLPGHDISAARGDHHSDPADRVGLLASLNRGLDPMLERRTVLKALSLAGGLFGLAFVFPIASFGPRARGSLYHTAWHKGLRLVTEEGRPVKIGELAVNGLMTVFPEGVTDINGLASSQTILMNLGNLDFHVFPGHGDWSPIHNGERYVAFSKVCTHAGCPVSLYNRESHQLICPCHQSTFNVLERCNPVFGPASRSLPQLPMAVDQNGYLIARSDYTEAIGPGFWNRGNGANGVKPA